MPTERLRFDLFAFALGALALLSLAFVGARNGAALVMCGLCFAGLIGARLLGFSNRALVPLALGLVVILWMVWIDPPASSRKTSALAHGAGGLLIGWALAEYLRVRIAWPLWGLAAMAAVFGLTVLWELGEYVGDRVLTTGLIPNKADSAVDILFGTAGGVIAVGAAWLLLPRRSAADE
jgi:hypothetical protein